MYLDYWGFSSLPFENVPDPKFFYLSKSHEEALTRLMYAGKTRKGCAILSGDVGCGKTTLTNTFVHKLSKNGFDIGLIINPKLEPLEFVQEVLYQFGVEEIPDTKVQCLHKLNERILESAKSKKEALLIVDEAQLLTLDNLEELRLLLNFQMNDRFLITIILVGQPELMERIKRVQPLNQRIAIRYHLTPFGFNDTVQYILFRQQRAGRKESAFSDEAVKKIYDHTKGIPRNINNICDLSLLVGYSENEKMIGPKVVKGVISDGTIL